MLSAQDEVLADPVADRYARVIADVAADRRIDLIVAAATTFAKDIVGRAAGLLGGAMAGDVTGHEFRDGRARFEEVPEEHHDHLIDVKTGDVVEFHSEEIEKLQIEIAERLGYKLVDHRLELYGVPLKRD